MLLQELKPLLPGAGPPVGMLPHPARRLRMPHQSVADELHAVLLGKSRLEVRGGEVKPARSRLHRGPFHLVSGRQGVVVVGQHLLHLEKLQAGGKAYEKPVSVDLFQRGKLPGVAERPRAFRPVLGGEGHVHRLVTGDLKVIDEKRRRGMIQFDVNRRGTALSAS